MGGDQRFGTGDRLGREGQREEDGDRDRDDSGLDAEREPSRAARAERDRHRCRQPDEATQLKGRDAQTAHADTQRDRRTLHCRNDTAHGRARTQRRKNGSLSARRVD